MSITLILGIATIIIGSLALIVIMLGGSRAGTAMNILLIVVGTAWLVAFVVENNIHQREFNCKLWPEDKECL